MCESGQYVVSYDVLLTLQTSENMQALELRELRRLDAMGHIEALVVRLVTEPGTRPVRYELTVKVFNLPELYVLTAARGTPRIIGNLNNLPAFISENCPKFTQARAAESRSAVGLQFKLLEQTKDEDSPPKNPKADQ